jgi:hypothetical protein
MTARLVALLLRWASSRMKRCAGGTASPRASIGARVCVEHTWTGADGSDGRPAFTMPQGTPMLLSRAAVSSSSSSRCAAKTKRRPWARDGRMTPSAMVEVFPEPVGDCIRTASAPSFTARWSPPTRARW